jgi:purine nucleoside permease
MTTTTTIEVREGSAPMSLHFSDADPVAACHVAECEWHGHGDSLNDAVTAWTKHLTASHGNDWE